MKKNWQFIKEEKVYSNNILSIRHLEYYYKVAEKSMVFTVQDMSSWAIIVPVTKDGEFILVRSPTTSSTPTAARQSATSSLPLRAATRIVRENCRKKLGQYQIKLYHLV